MQIGWVFFLFFLVFGLWQGAHILVHTHSLSGELQRFIDLAIQIVWLCILLLLIKREGVSFREYGFRWPQDVRKYTTVSLLFAFIYVIVTLFLPGSLVDFEFFPRTLSSNIPLEFLTALFTALVSESVFRGYIYGKLKKGYGFFPALCVSSVMFATLGSSFNAVISLLILGVFLGFFLQRTGSLVGPMTVYAVILLLYRFTPLKAAVTGQMTLFFEGIACVFLILLLHIFVVENHTTL